MSQSSALNDFVILMRTNPRRRTDTHVIAKKTAATATSCRPLYSASPINVSGVMKSVVNNSLRRSIARHDAGWAATPRYAKSK